MKKRSLILLLALLGSLISYALFHSRETGLCSFYCGDFINKIQLAFLFSFVILVFSLITYKLPARVFSAWWQFAKFAIPVVLCVSLLVNMGILHSSFGAWQNMLDVPVIILLYLLFILGSLIQIIRGYYQK